MTNNGPPRWTPLTRTVLSHQICQVSSQDFSCHMKLRLIRSRLRQPQWSSCFILLLVVLQGNISNFSKGADWKNHMVPGLIHKQSLWHTHLIVLDQTVGIISLINRNHCFYCFYFKRYKMSERLIYRLICIETVLKRESAVDKVWCGTISSTKANCVNCVMLLPCCTTSTTTCFIRNFMQKLKPLSHWRDFCFITKSSYFGPDGVGDF